MLSRKILRINYAAVFRLKPFWRLRWERVNISLLVSSVLFQLLFYIAPGADALTCSLSASLSALFQYRKPKIPPINLQYIKAFCSTLMLHAIVLTPGLICWQRGWGWTCRLRHLKLKCLQVIWASQLPLEPNEMSTSQGAQTMIQLTLWATSCRSNLYTAHLSVPRSWNSLIHTMKLLARSLARFWASSALPGIIETRFGHQPQPGTVPKEQGGFSHLVGKGESMTVWTCALPASWCHR